jgi:hypothetical protein
MAQPKLTPDQQLENRLFLKCRDEIGLDMSRFRVEFERYPNDFTLYVRDVKSAAYLAITHDELFKQKTVVEYPSHRDGEFVTFNGTEKECFRVLQFVADILADVRQAVDKSF